jgi:hypothetical protein
MEGPWFGIVIMILMVVGLGVWVWIMMRPEKGGKSDEKSDE